jgi:hypothetical protein
LRRAVPSFTVEVRRRPRLATKSNPDAQSSENKPPQGAFDRESHRAAAAAFEAKKVDQSPVGVAASYPRILPSLVADEPLRRLLRDASLSTAESEPTSRPLKRPSVRPLKGGAQASKPPRNSGSSSAESTPLADRLSAGSLQPSSARRDEGIGVSPSDPTTAPSQVVGNSGGPARAKAERRAKMPISLDDARATPLLNDQRSPMRTDSRATPPMSVDERSRQSRKRTIMGRYVFGDELKSGERWKRRLLRVALRRRHARWSC